MTDLSYMIWFLATAAMTITVITVGTLAAAELLPVRRRSRSHRRQPHARRPGVGPDEHGAQRTATGVEHHDHEHQAA